MCWEGVRAKCRGTWADVVGSRCHRPRLRLQTEFEMRREEKTLLLADFER